MDTTTTTTTLNLEDLSKLSLEEKRRFMEEKILISAKKDEFDVIVVMMDISGSVTDNGNFAYDAQIDEIIRLLYKSENCFLWLG